MKFLAPLFVAFVVFQMATALGNTQTRPQRGTAEVKIQYTETGAEYVHGDHCIDSRVF